MDRLKALLKENRRMLLMNVLENDRELVETVIKLKEARDKDLVDLKGIRGLINLQTKQKKKEA